MRYWVRLIKFGLMTPIPVFSEFEACYDAGRPQVVWTTLIADLETPVSVMLKLAADLPNSFLLESVEGGAVRGRYSMIGLKPDVLWRAQGNKAEINRRALEDLDAFEPCAQNTLDSLRTLLRDSHIDLDADLPPMMAGVFGYLGYDTIRLIETLPDQNPDVLNVPDGLLMRPTIMAIFDAVKDQIVLSTPVRPSKNVSAAEAYRAAEVRIKDVLAALAKPLPSMGEAPLFRSPLPDPLSNTTRDEYYAMVEKAKAYIAAGDIFQVVPSQRFEVPFNLPPLALYRSLRRLNPSPFLFYLNFGAFAVVGSSPEILVRLRDGRVTIRPIAGTRPRGNTPEQDRALAKELLEDPKERAEHLMLLDLGRNDVGRVSKIGSVAVTESFALEYYSHVMHIISNVEGELAPGEDAISALIAGFPAGTVSGAPKVRAMEIIDELETEKRGIYAGCVGYFSANGSMDTCIALRTAVVKDGKVYVQAGGGIVADSDPETEYQESVNKAKAVVSAVQDAVRFAGRNS